MPEQMIKDRFRNDSGGVIGVSIKRPGGLGFKSVPVQPGAHVDLDIEEQSETANAPKDPRNNPLANGWLTCIREKMEFTERRPLRHDPNLTANTAAALGVPSPDGKTADREPPGRAPAADAPLAATPPPEAVEDFPNSFIEHTAGAAERDTETALLSEDEVNARIAARNAELESQRIAEETATQVPEGSQEETGSYRAEEETGTPAGLSTEVTGSDVARQAPPAAVAPQPRPQPKPAS